MNDDEEERDIFQKIMEGLREALEHAKGNLELPEEQVHEPEEE